MEAAPRKFFTRGRPVAEPVTEPVAWRHCPCTNPDEKQFPAVLSGGALRGEFELPTAGDVDRVVAVFIHLIAVDLELASSA